MNKLLFTKAVVFLLICQINVYSQNWIHYKGLPEVSNVIKISEGHYEKVYALTSNREIYFSLDYGDSWNPFPPIPSFFNVYDIEASRIADRVYISTTCCGVAYTDSFGQNWQWDNLSTSTGGLGLAPNGIDSFNSITIAGAVNPSTSSNEIYISNNLGSQNTWSLTESFPINDIISGVYVFGSNLFFASFDVTTASTSLRRSVDSGQSFTDIPFFNGKQVTDVVVRIGGSIFCSANNNNQGYVYESNDFGDSWSVLPQISQGVIKDLEISLADGDLYAVTDDGVYILEYESNDWVNIQSETYIDNIAVNNQYIFTGGVKSIGLKRSPSDQLNFSTINFGKPNITWMQIANDNVFCGSGLNNIVSALNLNDTSNWVNLNMQDDINREAVAFSMDSDINGEGNIVVSGVNFIKEIDENLNIEQKIDLNTVNLPPPGFTNFLGRQMKIAPNGRMVIDQSEFLLPEFSLNEGADWVGALEHSGAHPGEVYKSIEVTNDNFFMLSSTPFFPDNRGLHWSSNGSDWNYIELPNNNGFARKLFLDNNDAIYILMQNPSELYKLDFDNLQWELIDLDLGTEPFYVQVEVKFDNNNKMYVLAYNLQEPLDFEGIRYRNEDDTAWEEIPFPTENGNEIKLNNLSFDSNNRMYARSASVISENVTEGIYYYEPALSTEEFIKDNISIYPNPVSSSFNVKSNIESKYSLYDTSGRLVISGQLTVGNNEVILNQSLSEGVYFFKAHKTNFSKKIVVTTTEE